jgi:hypothetical protein
MVRVKPNLSNPKFFHLQKDQAEFGGSNVLLILTSIVLVFERTHLKVTGRVFFLSRLQNFVFMNFLSANYFTL